MYWGVVMSSTAPQEETGEPYTEMVSLAHNLTQREQALTVIAEMKAMMQNMQKPTNMTVSFATFNHTFPHEDPRWAMMPETCEGCRAAISERLDILQENRAAEAIREDNARKAATEAAAGAGRTASVDSTEGFSFRPRQSTNS